MRDIPEVDVVRLWPGPDLAVPVAAAAAAAVAVAVLVVVLRVLVEDPWDGGLNVVAPVKAVALDFVLACPVPAGAFIPVPVPVAVVVLALARTPPAGT